MNSNNLNKVSVLKHNNILFFVDYCEELSTNYNEDITDISKYKIIATSNDDNYPIIPHNIVKNYNYFIHKISPKEINTGYCNIDNNICSITNSLNRQTGNTTRIIDSCVQDFFIYGYCTCIDHYHTDDTRIIKSLSISIANKVIIRLQTEHNLIQDKHFNTDVSNKFIIINNLT